MDWSGSNLYNKSAFGLAPGDKDTCDRVVWSNDYKNCPTTYYDTPGHINPLPDRYKVADLNPLIEHMRQLPGRLADPYDPRYFYGRTSLTQLRWLDVKNGSQNNRSRDKYMRFIEKPEQAWGVQQRLNGGKVPAFNKI